MAAVTTAPIYSWVLETKLVGAVDVAAVDVAAAQFAANRARDTSVWILDASAAPMPDPAVLGRVGQHVAALRATGLTRLGLIPPPSLRPYLAMVQQYVSVPVTSFTGRTAALEWLRRRCQ